MAAKQFKIEDPIHAPGTSFGNGHIFQFRGEPHNDIVCRFKSGMVSGWEAGELRHGHIEETEPAKKGNRCPTKSK